MRIVIAVTNDISTDQRVIRTASTLYGMGARVTVIGRHTGNTLPGTDPRFEARRMHLVFRKGPLFYVEYNVRLFFRLLFMKTELLVSNDLDTLPAAYLAAQARNTVLVYDSHEYFTEVPELVGRNRVRKIWERIESLILPHIRFAYTVSGSIAEAYNQKYGINMKVIRNLPFRIDLAKVLPVNMKTGNEKIILYQGSLNLGRGLELAIRAISFTRDTRLVIIGRGDVEEKLKELVQSLKLQEQVTLMGRVPPDRLSAYTIQADLGISLEEDLGLNYRYALPNKVFDYIQARVPVLVSDLPEVRALMERYQVGMVCRTSDPGNLGALFTEMTLDEEKRSFWKSNLESAAQELCWEREEARLIEIYTDALKLPAPSGT